MIAKWFIILLLITITLSQTGKIEQKEQNHQSSRLKVQKANQIVKNNELTKKHSVHLYKSHYQEYNFKIYKYIDLIIKAETEQEVLIVVDVLWRQKNIYLLAPVQKEQQISVYVQEQNKNYIYQDTFYTMNGFSFKAKANVSYKIIFKQNGSEEKMFITKISERVIPPKSAAKKDSMRLAQQKLTYALNKMQNILSQVKTGQLLDKQISSYVLHQSTTYSYFQAFQSILIVLISILQVLFVTKLLKVSSII